MRVYAVPPIFKRGNAFPHYLKEIKFRKKAFSFSPPPGRELGPKWKINPPPRS